VPSSFRRETMEIHKIHYLNKPIHFVKTGDETLLRALDLDRILIIFKPTKLIADFNGFYRNIYYRCLDEYEVSCLPSEYRGLEDDMFVTKYGLECFCSQNLEMLFFTWCLYNIFEKN
jgi:hypothetical protein